jgi:hypothetical protein
VTVCTWNADRYCPSANAYSPQSFAYVLVFNSTGKKVNEDK